MQKNVKLNFSCMFTVDGPMHSLILMLITKVKKNYNKHCDQVVVCWGALKLQVLENASMEK